MVWPPEAKEFALELVRGGASAGEVARRVNAEFEFKTPKSRNAVIGLAHRAKLRLRGRAPNGLTPRPKRKFGAYRAPQPPKPLSPIRAILCDGLPLPPPHETDVARVSFLELDENGKKHCKWPCGPTQNVLPDVKLFCGDARVEGSPYCLSHTKRAFNPLPARNYLPRVHGDRCRAAFDKTRALDEFDARESKQETVNA